jgi:integrase
VNEGRKQIELPGERTKNGRTHAVPLSAPALAVLESVPHKLDRDLIFGFGAGGFSGWSKAKARLDVRLGDEVKPWRLHDLRRSFATLSAEHGLAAPHAIEAVLNHQSGSKSGVVGIYNRAGYEQEKRQLLETWAAHLMRLVESE